MLWGAFDWQFDSENPYTSAQTLHGGTSAAPAPGNIGVRRASILFDRGLYTPADDAMLIHFDFLNLTAGAPDDTWTTTDYTNIEAALLAMCSALTNIWCTKTKVTQIAWYRHGPGITPPNPAERVLVLTTPIVGTASTTSWIPQEACSVTFRTAVRTSWGRTYLPFQSGTTSDGGRISSGTADLIANAVNAMVVAAAAADMHLVVTSNAKNAALVVEHIEVDDVLDVIRSRRWKHTNYRKILP